MENKQQPKLTVSQQFLSDKLFESIFELKMQAKEFAKHGKKSEKERDQMYEKVKEAIAENNPEAKLFATDAIRKSFQPHYAASSNEQLTSIQRIL